MAKRDPRVRQYGREKRAVGKSSSGETSLPAVPVRKVDLTRLVRTVMLNYGFWPDFPEKIEKEVQRFSLKSPDAWTEEPIADLRELLWSSIDNVDSRDLDQLEFCERRPRQEIRTLVAIADVDAFVNKGCATDQHASHNAASVYTGVQIFPMLPERLCTDLSSLNEGTDRLAVVIEFFVCRDGCVRAGEVFRAWVHNKAKLIYEEIGDWLEGQAELPAGAAAIDGLAEQLRLQDEAAGRLHEYRMTQGALELETIEASPVVADGKVVDLVVKHKNRARSLIENFMVAANGTMVQFLEKRQIPYIQRIVPTPERWPRIVELAQSLGDSLPEVADSRSLSEFLARRRFADRDSFPDLSLTIVKLLGAGEYVLAEPGKDHDGHFGLAVHDYTHSTAPNRRYVDVIIQRLLKSVLAKENSPYKKPELAQIAAWCTQQDKAAKKVERFMRKVAAAVLLQGRVGDVFDAIVTGASDKGTYVRLLEKPAEGRVMRGQEGMDVGQKVRVRLIDLDAEKGHIDFERAGMRMMQKLYAPTVKAVRKMRPRGLSR